MDSRRHLALTVLDELWKVYPCRIHDLAAEIGVSYASLFYYRHGRMPRKSTAERIIDVGFKHLDKAVLRRAYERSTLAQPVWSQKVGAHLFKATRYNQQISALKRGQRRCECHPQ